MPIRMTLNQTADTVALNALRGFIKWRRGLGHTWWYMEGAEDKCGKLHSSKKKKSYISAVVIWPSKTDMKRFCFFTWLCRSWQGYPLFPVWCGVFYSYMPNTVSSLSVIHSLAFNTCGLVYVTLCKICWSYIVVCLILKLKIHFWVTKLKYVIKEWWSVGGVCSKASRRSE